MNFLSGYKTYIAGVAVIATNVAAYANGTEQLPALLTAVFGALGLMFLRNGVNTASK